MDIVKAVTTPKTKAKAKPKPKESKEPKDPQVETTKPDVPPPPVEEVKPKAAAPKRKKKAKAEDYTDIEFYCVKCKLKGKCNDIVLEKDKKDKSRLKGACVTCGTKLYRYYSVA